jgi:hypothetical protein
LAGKTGKKGENDGDSQISDHYKHFRDLNFFKFFYKSLIFIQKPDGDADISFTNDCVGLPLRNTESDALDRGYALTNDPTIITPTPITAKAMPVPCLPAPSNRGWCSLSGT